MKTDKCEKEFLSEKDIYTLLNEVNSYDQEFEDIEIDEIRIKKLKNNLKKELNIKKMSKKMKRGLSIAGGLVVCISSVGVMGVKNPAFAKNIPVLNSIIKMLNNDAGYSGEYEKYSQAIDQTQYHKGISVTLDEVVYDQSEVMIAYTIKSDKKIGEFNEDVMPMENIKVNGKDSGYNGSSKIEYIDDYTVSVLCIADIGHGNLTDKFNMDFNITNIFNIKGKWNFAFELSKEELVKESKTFAIDMDKDFEGADINIASVDFTPLSTSVKISGEKSKSLNDLNSHSGFFEYDYWLLFDDKGNEIDRREGGSGGAINSNFKKEYKFDAIERVPEYLTVVPLQFRISQEGSIDEDGKTTTRTNKEEYRVEDVKKLISSTYPVEMEQGRFGKLTINEIEEKDNKTIVKYKANGKLPQFQGKNLYIENENGERIEPKITAINSGYDNEEFILEVEKLKDDEKYYFVTSNLNNFHFREDYIFKIPIK